MLVLARSTLNDSHWKYITSIETTWVAVLMAGTEREKQWHASGASSISTFYILIYSNLLQE